MSKPQPYSPIPEREKEGADDFPSGGCDCFGRFCFGRRGYVLQERGGAREDAWVVAKLKGLKEFSELVAGPKWKNMVRRIGKLCNPRRQAGAAPVQFQYSPESYALNFAGDDVGEDGNLLHSFSTRFAVNDQQRTAGFL